jgi:hypothetical protein
MFHILFNIPMSSENFNKEKNYIFQTGLLNGYSFDTLDKMFKKHERKREIANVTSLESIDEDVSKFVRGNFSITFFHFSLYFSNIMLLIYFFGEGFYLAHQKNALSL